MTASLLKRAREALILARSYIPDSIGFARNDGEKVEDLINVIDTQLSLPAYDRFVEDIAPYLPEGVEYIAFDGTFYIQRFQHRPFLKRDFWEPGIGAFDRITVIADNGFGDWRTSLRRIYHTPEGVKVTKEEANV